MEKVTSPKGCYNCVKRRIICDKTGTRCQKCAKKGLTCPGYGIRYRFAHEVRSQKPASTAPFEQNNVTSRFSSTLKWVHTSIDKESMGTIEAAPIRKAIMELPTSETEREQRTDDTELDENMEVISSTCRVGQPRTLEMMDANSRWMFHYFSEHVSPVMVLFNGYANGYRRHILPFAVSNSMVQRAVCVAAAFHLIPRRPELRAPAERGRAAIIQKLREDGLASATVFDESTWATILLLIVGDLVAGDEQIMILYHMLDAFLRAGGFNNESQSRLTRFLKSQSTLIKFFGRPIVSEAASFPEMAEISDTPILDVLSGSDDPPDDSHQTRKHIQLYNKAFNLAITIYLHRVRSSAQDEYIGRQVDLLRQILEKIDPTYPGAHVIVWPCFIGAAEADSTSHRIFFTGQLSHIWKTTGYGNVLKALDALPRIWERKGVERWTSALPQLSVVVM
ncbi:hypothetical protein G7046_g3748 [Stylonectria norvegica]|nr:hypothetical protein G7046_g3748 [Stylonectria norvegica]